MNIISVAVIGIILVLSLGLAPLIYVNIMPDSLSIRAGKFYFLLKLYFHWQRSFIHQLFMDPN